MVTAPGSRKRLISESSDMRDVVTDLRKRRREDSSGLEQTPREEALMREVEQLRRELEKVQQEKDVLIGVIGQLTQKQN
jgi:hypothetical protein